MLYQTPQGLTPGLGSRHLATMRSRLLGTLPLPLRCLLCPRITLRPPTYLLK